jgi:LmbE family N-acetylglucosaminyl deacetylase
MKGRTLIVVAHPDDETLAFFSAMHRFGDCVIVHVTDGSPLNLHHARNAGFETRAAYARARRAELDCALSVLGGRETRELGFVDQETWRDLPGLVDAVAGVIREVRPSVIFTHPYEGGHPDHDSTAFAVARAVRCEDRAVEVREGAFYNAFGSGEVLQPDSRDTERRLSAEAWSLKRRMLDCFVSQASVLNQFNLEIERERAAPEHDFTVAPHAGPLNYEGWGLAFNGADWRAAARKALGRCV